MTQKKRFNSVIVKGLIRGIDQWIDGIREDRMYEWAGEVLTTYLKGTYDEEEEALTW